MNKIRTKLALLLCTICAAATLTSCLNDDSEENTYTPPTQAEKTAATIAVTGSYSGMLHYYKQNTAKYDSVAVHWIIADSVLTIRDFPCSVLANFVTDAKIKSVLENSQTTQFKAKLSLYRVTATGTSATSLPYYQFSMLPTEYINFNSVYEDTPYTGTVNYADYIYFSGQYLQPIAAFYNKQFQGNICLKDITVNNYSYSISTPLGLYGKKQ